MGGEGLFAGEGGEEGGVGGEAVGFGGGFFEVALGGFFLERVSVYGFVGVRTAGSWKGISWGILMAVPSTYSSGLESFESVLSFPVLICSV